MSLDRLVQKTIRSRTNQVVDIFLPPEYETDLDEWRKHFAAFNEGARPARLAYALQQYIREKNPSKTDFSQCIKAGKIVEDDGAFTCECEFENDKAGLTALYLSTLAGISLIPILGDKVGLEPGIAYVVLSYVPE